MVFTHIYILVGIHANLSFCSLNRRQIAICKLLTLDTQWEWQHQSRSRDINYYALVYSLRGFLHLQTQSGKNIVDTDCHFFLPRVICGLSLLKQFGREDGHPDSLLIATWEDTTIWGFLNFYVIEAAKLLRNSFWKFQVIVNNTEITFSDQLALVETWFSKV